MANNENGLNMEGYTEATAREAGLSRDDILQIILLTIVANGGTATIGQIYQAIEAVMKEHRYVLSSQGKASIRRTVHSNAVKLGYVTYLFDQSKWRIAEKGWEYLQFEHNVENEKLFDDQNEFKIQEPYDPYQIRVELTPFTIFQVMQKMKLKEIKLQPAFQRRVVWDDIQQSRLIESILIRIPLPAFYLDAVDYDNWLVVDGLQRLYTLDKFFNKDELQLRSLEFLPQLNGKTFAELPRKHQRQIEDTKLNFYIIEPNTPPHIKFTIFYRINTGGLLLTAQEIRHALFQGKATTLLQQLADSEAFLEATTYSISPKRMDDRECVLRFLAFHLNHYTNYQTADFHSFLSDTMQLINDFNETDIRELEITFNDTMIKAKKIFGSYAFRKLYAVDGRWYSINKALFEVWSVNLVSYSLEELTLHKEKVIQGFIKIMNSDSKFGRAITQGTGSVHNVQKRFKTIEALLAEVMRDD